MNRRSMGILLAVAMLVGGLATPAAAKKGGHPGPPSGTGLEVTVEPSSGFMWANSAGDQILFDITVTNTSGAPLEGIAVEFGGVPLGTVNLDKNESWAMQHTYTVLSADFDGRTPNKQNSVTVGIVTATDGTVTDSADAVMTAYPVPPCGQATPGGAFTFPTTDDYAVCAFSGTGEWTLTVTLPKPTRGKQYNPSATVRDGVPGNWCMVGDAVASGDTATVNLLLPVDGTCLAGGAGGAEIPVRNHDTYYLATWRGNTVDAAPPPPPEG